MLFSATKWKGSQEIKQHVKVSVSLSFEQMGTPLRNAYDTFIASLLEEEMSEKLIEYYNAEDPTPEQKKLVELAQSANANLAFYSDYEEINTRITDSGFQRQENEESAYKGLYQYQERNLKESFRNKGFNALDRMLEYLEIHIEHFAEFKKSKAYSFRRDSIVYSASYANRFYRIENSRIIFLRMIPHLDMAELTSVRQVLGTDLYTHFKNAIIPDYSGEDKKNVDALRDDVARVMMLIAARRLMIDGGRLTDRGLYFQRQEANSRSGESREKADRDILELSLNQLKADIESAVSILSASAKLLFPSYFAMHPHEAYNRDNHGKRTFFA